jgi:hypothetical protein
LLDLLIQPIVMGKASEFLKKFLVSFLANSLEWGNFEKTTTLNADYTDVF